MDGIQPVGAMIQPQPANSGLNAYSTLLGIQQQQLGIQQQKQGLQGQAAQVSQEQQKNQEMQAAHQVAVKAAQGGYNAPDGSLDRARMSQDISAIGPYAQGMAGSLLSQANEAIQNKRAIQNLTVERKQEIGNTLLSLQQDPNLSQSKFIDEVERLRSQHPNDPEFSRLLTSTTAMAVSPGDSPDQMRSKLGQLWSSVSGQPVQKPYAVGVGPGIISGGENVLSGARTPQSFQKVGLGPAQEPGYLTQVAGQTAAASTTGAGGSKIDVETYNKALTAGAQSATVMDLSKRIEREAGEVRTGKFSQEFANRLTVFQQHNPGATATQMLQKDAANLKTMIEGGLVNPTDAERAAAGAGLPSPETMGPDALQKAARYWQGYAQMTGGRRDLALQHIQQTGSIAGYAARDSQYMAKASPGALEPKQTATEAQLADYARRKKISVEAARAHATLHQVEITK